MKLIQGRLVVCDDDPETGIRGDCYDFRIGHVLRKGQQAVSGTGTVVLKPGEMATLVTHEELNMPFHITGMVIPRNSSALNGILMLNAGHVDPGWKGPIMAQVVNLSDQHRSIQLESFEGSVFSVVFSYLHSTAKIKLKPAQPKAQRIASLQRRIDEQSDTLVIAESTMRNRFVATDQFTPLLWRNTFGFLGIIAVAVTIWASLAKLTDSNIKTDWNWTEFGPAFAAVFSAVLLAQMVKDGLYHYVFLPIRVKLRRIRR